jgi:ABC-type amino acid transport system permease subunit
MQAPAHYPIPVEPSLWLAIIYIAGTVAVLLLGRWMERR